MIEKKVQRAEPDDPNRCQAVVAHGQCPYLAVEGARNCAMHGGSRVAQNLKKQALRQYRLDRWTDRAADFANHDQIKTLNEEIGILRMTLEQVVVQCTTPLDMALNQRTIAELVAKIEKIVMSCTALERQAGQFLDKGAAIQLAGQMVTIISKYVTDPDMLNSITEEMTDAVLSLKGVEK